MSNESPSITIQPLQKSFGAVVTGVRLTELDDNRFDEIYQAWLKYALLIFPEQHLSDEDQTSFARRFGNLIEGLEAAEISNVLADGSMRDAPDDDMMKIIRGNLHWHQDNTYMPIQAKGAVFSAKVVPKAQGDTAFADMRAAWDALDETTRDRLSCLSAHHSLARSQKALGEETKSKDSEYMGYGLIVEDIPRRPLLKIHPETGRKTLAVGRHAFGVTGLSQEESASLLDKLIEFSASDDRRCYQHRWTQGDVVVWDNRCLMHRGCAWDYSEPRVMLHSRIAGDPMTESAEQA
ncbi:MAG: alpha-ketoglutarate-dependent taurine dioxygenase [Glaciecola sp.]|jgi:alpha-ketoglutarate-dependent taurine dioxygenase|uniref:TauD/TfdA dioxygenase family protein n=1 Tax=Congregibacter sp. TaxID=2744308 RepID=UPI0039E3BB43